MTHTVYLSESDNKRTALFLEEAAPGTYRLVGAEGYTPLDYYDLCFDLENLDPEVKNHDVRSASYTCFGMSQHVEGPELTIKGLGEEFTQFRARNLQQVQSGLDRLRGQFINTDDY